MPGPSAGRLNRRVTIEQGVAAQTTEGDALLEWQWLADVWANVNPLSTQELLLAAQRGEEVTHSVEIRYQPKFFPPQDLRIKLGGRIMYVVGAMDPSEEHWSLVLQCKEYVSGAERGAA